MKDMHFDVEIIVDSQVYCVTNFQISQHKMYRGIDVLTLDRILHEIGTSSNNEKVTINIRGVNY